MKNLCVKTFLSEDEDTGRLSNLRVPLKTFDRKLSLMRCAIYCTPNHLGVCHSMHV